MSHTAESMEIKAGSRVIDNKGRMGTVKGKWGAFAGCPQCARIIAERYSTTGTLRLPRTECCQVRPIVVAGDDIFEIRRDDGGLSILHQDWLTII